MKRAEPYTFGFWNGFHALNLTLLVIEMDFLVLNLTLSV